MPFRVILYHNIISIVISYHVISYHAMPCHATPCHAMPCHVMPYYTIYQVLLFSRCGFMKFAIQTLLYMYKCSRFFQGIFEIFYSYQHFTLTVCHTMSYYIKIPYQLSYHAMPSHAISCHAMPCHDMTCHTMPCHATPSYATSCTITPCHVMPCHVMSRNAMPCHVMPCPIISYIRSYYFQDMGL